MSCLNMLNGTYHFRLNTSHELGGSESWLKSDDDDDIHLLSYIIIYHLVIISYHYLSFISPRSGNIFFGATPAFGASLSACHAALSALCFRRGEL